ncbi:hypothetical protein HanRHA438_Chr01g0008261 [Helianthus annuus]|nr:hypothetical protein HanRHA438_Chr01g0008261 [Helianthus annuus]
MWPYFFKPLQNSSLFQNTPFIFKAQNPSTHNSSPAAPPSSSVAPPLQPIPTSFAPPLQSFLNFSQTHQNFQTC